MSEPLSDYELADLRRHMAEPGKAEGSGRGHGWPWGNPATDDLVRRLLATIGALEAEFLHLPVMAFWADRVVVDGLVEDADAPRLTAFLRKAAREP